MPRTIRFHLDENCARAIADGLRRHGIDVTTTSEVGLLGATDAEQWEYSLTHDRVLFTQDSDFLVSHRSGEAHNGIVYCPMESRSVGQIVRGLLDIWDLLEPEEMAGRVEFL